MKKRLYSDEQVRDIVALYKFGNTTGQIGEIYKADRHAIANILKSNNVTLDSKRYGKDITGVRFGRLVAINWTGKNGSGGRKWLCECDCGITTEVSVGSLTNGNTKSCGCLAKEARDSNRKKLNEKRKLPAGESTLHSVMNEYKVSARRRKIDWQLTVPQFKDVSTKPCKYCGMEPVKVRVKPRYNGEFRFNGVDRVDNNVGYVFENCVPCCTTCNVAKATMSRENFLLWVSRVYSHSIVGGNGG